MKNEQYEAGAAFARGLLCAGRREDAELWLGHGRGTNPSDFEDGLRDVLNGMAPLRGERLTVIQVYAEMTFVGPEDVMRIAMDWLHDRTGVWVAQGRTSVPCHPQVAAPSTWHWRKERSTK